MIPIAIALLLVTAAGTRASAPPSVLTNNEASDEPGFPSEVSYTVEPEFDNQTDSGNRRLLNEDSFFWSNKSEATVKLTFDEAYRFEKFALYSTRTKLPAQVTVSIAGASDGPWEKVGVFEPEGRTGWHSLHLKRHRTARYVKLHFRNDAGTWIVNAFKAWGRDEDVPGDDVEMPEIHRDGKLVLVNNNEPAASIIVGQDARSKSLTYARFLQQSIKRMTDAVLPVRTNRTDWSGTRIHVGPRATEEDVFPQGLEEPGGYRIRVDGRRVTLVGNDRADPSATGWAVYDLLESLGFGWFGPDELYHVVPEASSAAVKPMDRREVPDFEYRRVWDGNAHHHTRLAWRLGGRRGRSLHNIGRIVPKKRFREHPEYFPLLDGERKKRGQRNLSHPAVQRMAIEHAREYAEAHPRERSIPLGQNDMGGFDQSPRTLKMGPNTSAQFLEFTNIVARAVQSDYPERPVTMSAYWHTYSPPPEGVKAEPNVMVMVVNQACHAHAIDNPDCPVNAEYRKNFSGWKATGAQLGSREWYIPAHSKKNWKHLPWIQTEVIARNLRFWKQHDVNWINIETPFDSEYPLRWPLYYVVSEMIWDVEQDPEELLGQACAKLYGTSAGKIMSRYFKLLAEAMQSSQKHESTWNLPPAGAVFRPDIVRKARSLLDQALAEFPENTVEYRRVAKENATWARAEQELDQLPDNPRNMVDARPYNGMILFTNKDTVTGKYLIDLVGITETKGITVQEGDSDPRSLTPEAEFDATNGLKIDRDREQSE